MIPKAFPHGALDNLKYCVGWCLWNCLSDICSHFYAPHQNSSNQTCFSPPRGLLRLIQWCQHVFLCHVLVSSCTMLVQHYVHTNCHQKTNHIQHTIAEEPFWLEWKQESKSPLLPLDRLTWFWVVKGFRHSHEQGACTLTSPSFRVQENDSLSFSSSSGFTELAYVRAEQSSKSQGEMFLSPQLLGHH